MTSLKHWHLLVYFSISLPLQWNQYAQRKNTTLVKGRTVQWAPVRPMFTVALGTKQGRFCKPSGVLLHSLCSNHTPGLNPHQIQALLMALVGKTTSSQTNTNFEVFATCQGGLWELAPFSDPTIRSGTGMGSQKWEESPCVYKLHAERSKREEPGAGPPDPVTGNVCSPKPLNCPFSGLCLLY